MKIFSECPIALAQMKIMFNIYKVPIIIDQNKNSQNAKKFQALRFSECPIFWAEMKKKTFITFPSRLKFPKLPKSFPSILEKKSHEYFRA
jgi:hypothetical protein